MIVNYNHKTFIVQATEVYFDGTKTIPLRTKLIKLINVTLHLCYKYSLL
jgi:hypothetical protein